MSERGTYGQFCPVAMAAEVVCTRWTPLILRELLAGTHRFNDLRRGVPRMSPTLLSKRLKELEEAGVVLTVRDSRSGTMEYHLTEAGEDLRPIVMSLGTWGQRWVETRASLRNLDPTLLMWDMRRCLKPQRMPKQRSTIAIEFPELGPARRSYWLVVDPEGLVDLCQHDPGYDVDLFITCSLRILTAIWMGLTTIAREIESGELELTGNRNLVASMQEWLGLSPFAGEPPRRHSARLAGR